MSSEPACPNPDACYAMNLEWVPIESIAISEHNARKHSPAQIRQLGESITTYGWMTALVVDPKRIVIVGAGRLQAARRLKLQKVPVIFASHLSEDQIRAYRIADNRLAQLSSWDDPILARELQHLITVDIDLVMSIGFETPKLDLLLRMGETEEEEDEDFGESIPIVPVSRPGDIWASGGHRLICADARDGEAVARVLGGRKIRLIVEDRPFNVPVQGHVSGLGRARHKEFAMASGEMSREEYQRFLEALTAASLPHLMPGSLIFQFIDWRHIEEMAAAQRAHFGDMFNLAVWGKTNAGMGSFYRSQHELCCVHKFGKEPHVNNVQLGKHGRYRSNLWIQAGANSFGKTRDEDLQAHPTVKPTSLISDIILDASNIKDCVFDGCVGSGSSLVACARTDRIGCGVEIDPGYVDVALKRLSQATKLPAVLCETGQTFDGVAHERLGKEG